LVGKGFSSLANQSRSELKTLNCRIVILRIMSLRFVDRQRELELLKDFASQKRAGIAVVYGRRVSLYVGIGRYISLYLSYA